MEDAAGDEAVEKEEEEPEGSQSASASQEGNMSQPGMMSQEGNMSQPGMMSQEGNMSQPGMMSQEGNVSQAGMMSQEGNMSQPGMMSQEGNMSQPGMMSQEGNMSQPGMMLQEGTSQQTVELEECWASQSSRGVSALDETGAAIDADSQPTASQQSSQGALTQDTAADVAEAHVAHVAHAGAAASQKTALQAELTAVGDEYRQHRDAMHPPISAAERYAAVKEAVTVHLSTVPPPSAAELACFERRQPFCVRVPPPVSPRPAYSRVDIDTGAATRTNRATPMAVAMAVAMAAAMAAAAAQEQDVGGNGAGDPVPKRADPCAAGAPCARGAHMS